MAAKQPQKRSRPQDTAGGRLSRSILIGAALGAYFGLIFRPFAEGPSLWIVIFYSLFAALAATLARAWQVRRQTGGKLPVLVRYALRMWFTFALFLAMLEGRHIAYSLGGRLVTTLFTTVAGAGLGAWYAITAQKEEP